MSFGLISAEEFGRIIGANVESEIMISANLAPSELDAAAELLKKRNWRFCLLTIWDLLDTRRAEYIFRNDETDCTAVIELKHEKNEKLPSISRHFPFCGLQEKEVSELFGVMFDNLEYSFSACLAREYRKNPSPMSKNR